MNNAERLLEEIAGLSATIAEIAKEENPHSEDIEEEIRRFDSLTFLAIEQLCKNQIAYRQQVNDSLITYVENLKKL